VLSLEISLVIVTIVINCNIIESISRQDISQLIWLTSIMLHIKSSSLVMTIIVASAATLVISSVSQELQSKVRHQSKSFDSEELKNGGTFIKEHRKSSISTKPLSSKSKKSNQYRGKYLMPLLSTTSALSQLRLTSLKPLAFELYKNHPLPQESFNLLNHRRNSDFIIERLNTLRTSAFRVLQKRFKNDKNVENSSDVDAQHRKEEISRILPKKYNSSADLKTSNRIKNEASDHKKAITNVTNSKKKRHKSYEDKMNEDVAKVDAEMEDEIINEPITNYRKNRISRVDFEKIDDDDKDSKNSSYGLSLANERSLPELSKSSNSEKTGGSETSKSSRSTGKAAAAIVLAPSLESIAMRIVSAAASKSIGRSSAHLSSSGNSQIGHSSSSSTHGGETLPQSLLSSLSSTILSTAMSHIINFNSTNPFAASTSSLSSWPNKLSPLLYSLASLSGLNSDDSSNLPSSSPSFLSADLSTSSSSSQPTIYNSGSVGRPHTSKQYSPTMLGIVNLARYVLCK